MTGGSKVVAGACSATDCSVSAGALGELALADVVLWLSIAATTVAAASLWSARRSAMHQGALVALGPTVPIAAVTNAVVLYLTWCPTWPAPLIGLALALLFWCGVALLIRELPTAQRCNQSSHGELTQRLTQLEARLADAERAASAATAVHQARGQCTEIHRALEAGGLPWVMGTGYINMWKRLHRAEEALIDVIRPEVAVGQALKDELRLQDSKITNRDDLLLKLRFAVVSLDPGAQRFLKLSSDDAKLLEAHAAEIEQKGEQLEAIARPVLRTVRRALNEYVDDLYDSLATARNRLWGTTIVAGMTAFVLLTVAMIAGATPSEIATALAYYLVGAVVGLLSRLRAESEESKSVPDYGLSNARLFSTPLYCGLAAVGGVVLASGLPTLMGNAGNDLGVTKTLSDVFTLDAGGLGRILVAAVFGLTPTLLLTKLQEQSEKYKSDLQSSEATQGR